jgi:hypothetical protein
MEDNQLEPELSKKELLKKKKQEEKQKLRKIELEQNNWKIFDEKNKQKKTEQKQAAKKIMNEKNTKVEEKETTSIKMSKPNPVLSPMKCYLLKNKSKTAEDWKNLDDKEKEVYKKIALDDKERYKKELVDVQKKNEMVERVTAGKKERRR